MQIIDIQYFGFYHPVTIGYETQKDISIDNQLLTSHLFFDHFTVK